MKKFWMILALSAMFAAGVVLPAAGAQAGENAAAGVKKTAVSDSSWDIFQLGFAFNYPSSQDIVPVYGFRIGAPFCGGIAPVYGVEGALLGAGGDDVSGVQFGLCAAMSKKVTGLQCAFYNQSEEVNGVQLGVVNVSEKKGFQIGLINIIKDGWLPWSILINFNF